MGNLLFQQFSNNTRQQLARVSLLFSLLFFSLFSFAQTTSWRGNSNSDWGTSSNWTAGIPDATKDVIIGDRNINNYPIISSAAKCKSLTIGANKTGKLTVNADLTVQLNITINTLGTLTHNYNNSSISLAGNWGNSGVYNVYSGTPEVVFAGTNQTIEGSNETTFKNVVINSGTTVLLKKNCTVQSTLSISGTLDPNESPTFKATINNMDFNGGAIVKVNAASFQDNYAVTGSKGYGWLTPYTIDYSSTSVDQVIDNSLTYATLRISGSTKKKLLADLSPLRWGFLSLVQTTINVSSGTFDLAGYTANTSGLISGLFTIEDGATVRVGGTNTFPANYTTYALQPGSTVEYYGSNQSLASNLVYGHLALTNAGTKTAAGALTIAGNLTINSANFVAGSYNHLLQGNWLMNSGTFTNAGSTITLNGTGVQTISSTGAFNNLSINKTSGSTTIATDVTVNNLNFIKGQLNTGVLKLMVAANGSVTGAGANTGWVNGNLQKYFAASASATNGSFEVGGTSYYNPVNIAFAQITTAGNLLATNKPVAHPNVNSSDFPVKNISTYWTITKPASASVAYTGATITLNWDSAANFIGLTPEYLGVGNYRSSAWSYPTVTDMPATSTISFDAGANLGEFTVGEKSSCGVWTGAISTVWTNKLNWSCSNVPSSNSKVVIPSGLARYPEIPAATSVKIAGLDVKQGALLSLKGELEITGNLMAKANIAAETGSLKMSGNSAQVIGNVFVNELASLTINNAAGVTITDSLKLNDILSLDKGTLYTSNLLVLKSTTNNTARVSEIPSGNASPIVGDVTVERYVPGRRKYRLITSSVTTSSKTVLSAGEERYSMWGNWQEGGRVLPGVGTKITGGTTTDGFDAGTSNASIYTYNSVTRNYVPFSSANGNKTIYTPLKAGVPYYMFVYGDRTNTITSQTPSPTVLRATGKLLTGDQVYTPTSALPLSNVPGQFSLIGNPFACTIDWSAVEKTNIDKTIWGWDANLSSTGGYVTVTVDDLLGIVMVAPLSNLIAVDKLIQPGQGFFVRTNNVNPKIVIRETNKIKDKVSINSNVFRTTGGSGTPLMAVNLTYSLGSTKTLNDGAVAAFNDGFDNSVTEDDGKKMAGSTEGLGFMEDTSLLSINTRKWPVEGDTLKLNIARLVRPVYSLQIFANNMDTLSAHPYLYDDYLKTATPLSVTDTNNITFSINNTNPQSKSENRFSIIFKSGKTLPVSFTSITATRQNKNVLVSWGVASDDDVHTYQLQKSANGVAFATIGEVRSHFSATPQQYTYTDGNVLPGNHFYRVKTIHVDGKFEYSKIAGVRIDANTSSVSVTPNPAINHELNLQFVDLPSGMYSVIVYNMNGQQVSNSTIAFAGGSASVKIPLDKKQPVGMYQLRVTGNSITHSQMLLVQ